MPDDNERLFRSGLEAVNRRDLDALAEVLHDDAEWHPALTTGGLGRDRRGTK